MNKSTNSTDAGARRSFLRLLTLTLGAGVIASLLQSCTPQQKDEFEVDIVIEQSQIHYSPATLKIPRGSTVTWLNKSYYSQSATCDPGKARQGAAASLPAGAQPWNSGLLYPGQRYTRRFDVPGTYIYFSLPLLSPGTIGSIIVE